MTTSITEILPERDAVNTGIMLQNLSGSVDVYLGPYNSGDGALTTSNGILLAAGASLVLGGNGAVFKDAVYGRTGSGVADVRYLRWG
ncbi:MAG: hypothetical protein CMH57_02780 [Myxococcales bacterium]|nr:hypothetical protein [Myxococcales bacterium]